MLYLVHALFRRSISCVWISFRCNRTCECREDPANKCMKIWTRPRGLAVLLGTGGGIGAVHDKNDDHGSVIPTGHSARPESMKFCETICFGMSLFQHIIMSPATTFDDLTASVHTRLMNTLGWPSAPPLSLFTTRCVQTTTGSFAIKSMAQLLFTWKTNVGSSRTSGGDITDQFHTKDAYVGKVCANLCSFNWVLFFLFCKYCGQRNIPVSSFLREISLFCNRQPRRPVNRKTGASDTQYLFEDNESGLSRTAKFFFFFFFFCPAVHGGCSPVGIHEPMLYLSAKVFQKMCPCHSGTLACSLETVANRQKHSRLFCLCKWCRGWRASLVVQTFLSASQRQDRTVHTISCIELTRSTAVKWDDGMHHGVWGSAVKGRGWVVWPTSLQNSCGNSKFALVWFYACVILTQKEAQSSLPAIDFILVCGQWFWELFFSGTTKHNWSCQLYLSSVCHSLGNGFLFFDFFRNIFPLLHFWSWRGRPRNACNSSQNRSSSTSQKPRHLDLPFVH